MPLLGWLSSVLSLRIKVVQKTIVAETAALAGSTTESLRNIEVVKSMGLGAQEVARLNAATHRILGPEFRKVRCLRSLSFVQGFRKRQLASVGERARAAKLLMGLTRPLPNRNLCSIARRRPP